MGGDFQTEMSAPKIIDGDELTRLIYVEPPPCPRAMQLAIQGAFNDALAGNVERQRQIALCLTYASSRHDPEDVAKLMFIVCTGRAPFIV